MKWAAALMVVLAGAALVAWSALYPYAFNHHAAERRLIWHAAATMKVNPWLLTAVVESESHFKSEAVSRRGALGLMQIEPSTGRWVEGKAHITGALTAPAVNVQIGAWYLRYLQRSFDGNLIMTLAAYNGGPAVVERWERQGTWSAKDGLQHIPYGETRYFVMRVLWRYRFYQWISHHSLVMAALAAGHADVGEVLAWVRS